MLKSKSKVFKPKGPSRRPQPSREPTPSLKRKEREDDVTLQPPAKRIPTPVPEISAPLEKSVDSSHRDGTPEVPQPQYPSPEPSQAATPEKTTKPSPVIHVTKESKGTQDKPAIQKPLDAVHTNFVVPTKPSQADPPHTEEDPLPVATRVVQDAAVEKPIPDAAASKLATVTAPTLDAAGEAGRGSFGTQIAPDSETISKTVSTPDGTPSGISETPAEKENAKKIVRRKKAPATADEDVARPTVEVPPKPPRRTNKNKGVKKNDKTRKPRDATPEGAEHETVDPAILTMSDLCKDLKIGKKFSKHQDIRDRLLAKKLAADKEKLRKTHPEMIPLLEGEGTNSESTATTGTAPHIGNDGVIETAQGKSLQMRIVDGQIVIDDRFTQIDRHKEAQEAQGDLEMVEENEFSQITTSGSHMKREKSQAWDYADMDLFYKGIRTFGTDFEMIAKMFPNRNRRQIKLKFNKEERENPNRLGRALNGERLTVDFQEYEELAREKFQELHEIEAERLALEKEHHQEQAKVAADSAETIREKREAIHAKSSAAQRALSGIDEYGGSREGDSAKENMEPASTRSKSREASVVAHGRGKKKGADKSKKNKHSSRAGGEEVEVFGEI